MKKFLFSLVAVMALAFTGFAQDVKPLAENQVGGYFVYDRSDAQTPENSVGAGAFGILNVKFGKLPVSFRGDAFWYTDQAYLGTGRVIRGDFKARTPLGLKYNFVGQESEVYAVAGVGLEHQEGGANSFNPKFGAGFKTGDNVLTEYAYIINPNRNNSVRGHEVSVEFFRPLENNPKWNVVTGFTGFAGTGQFGPADPQALSNVKFFIGLSRKY